MKLKKIISLVTLWYLFLTLTLMIPTTLAISQTFQDVTSDMWSYKYIEFGVQNNFFDKGEYFRPYDYTNRAELAKLAFKVAQLKGLISHIDYDVGILLNDIPEDSWFAPYVAMCLKYGIVRGYKDIHGNWSYYYGANDNTTRAQAVKVFNKVSGISKTLLPSSNFKDVNIGDWFYEDITTAYNQSIIDGYIDIEGNPTGYFGPNDPITREQIAKIIYYSLNPEIRDYSLNEEKRDGNEYSDVDNKNKNEEEKKVDVAENEEDEQNLDVEEEENEEEEVQQSAPPLGGGGGGGGGSTAPSTYNLTVQKDGTGTGNVTASIGNINCGDTCVSSYSVNTPVVLTATPDENSIFVYWEGEHADNCDDIYYHECNLVMHSNKQIIARFELLHTLNIDIASNGEGTIKCGKPGEEDICRDKYTHGEEVRIVAESHEGSIFAGWGWENCSYVNENQCIVEMNLAKNITAYFNILDDGRNEFITRKLTNFSVVEGTESVKIFEASIKANSTSDLKLNEIKISTNDGGYAHNGFNANNITEVKAYLDGQKVGNASNISENSVTIDNINEFIPAGQTHLFVVEVNFSSSFDNEDAGFETFVADIADIKLDNNTSLYFLGTDINPSRNIELVEAGSFKIVLENNVPDVGDIYVIAGTKNLDRAIARLDVEAKNEDILWQELTLERSAGDATGDDIVEICLYDDEWIEVACTMTQSNDSSAVFEDMGIVLEANTVNEFYVIVEAEGINPVRVFPSNIHAQYKMTHAGGRGVSSGMHIILAGADKADVVMGNFDHESETNEARVVAVAPIHVEAVALSDTTLTGETAGINTIARLRVHPYNANSDAELKLIELNIEYNSNPDLVITGVRAYWSSNSGTKVDGVIVGDQLKFDTAALIPLKGIKSTDTLVIEITGVEVVDNSYFQASIDLNSDNIVFNDSYNNFSGLRLNNHIIEFDILSN